MPATLTAFSDDLSEFIRKMSYTRHTEIRIKYMIQSDKNQAFTFRSTDEDYYQ